MNVTREVVKDLLTVCLAGEASADTRALVEEWLRGDPELARQADLAGRIALPAVAPLPVSAEKRTLDRTRRHLHWRSVVLGLAIYVTTLPLSVTFGTDGRFHGLLIDNWPERFVVVALALAVWVAYWRMGRRGQA